jgi:hypothetical protein
MGRPLGSTNDRLWRDALRKVAQEYAEGDCGPKKIEIVAKRLVEAAMNGDISAAKEFGDRLDGKPQQALEHTGGDGGPLVVSWQPPQS